MILRDRARPADLAAIADLFQEAFPEALLAVFGKPRLPSRAVSDLLAGIFAVDPGGFFVARQEGRVTGFIVVTAHLGRLYRRLILGGTLWTMAWRWISGRYAGLGPGFVPRLAGLLWDYREVEKQLGAQDADTSQIISIVVDPGVRRQGVGRELTETALQYLRESRARVVRLEVDAAKEGPIALYRSFGFREVARLPTPRGPALVMTLLLK